MDITTTEAAGLLGVTDAEVRRLLREGLLTGRRVGTIWLVDASDVHRRRHLGAGRGRTWTAHVAFAAVLLLAGRCDAGLSDSEMSRLRRSLRNSEAMDVVRRARDLTVLEVWRVPGASMGWLTSNTRVFLTDESAISRISGELVTDSRSNANRVTHVGIPVGDVESVRVGARARAAKDSANVSVHVVRTDLSDWLTVVSVQDVITALLLGTHEDARVRATADHFLSERLAELHRSSGR